MHPFARRDLYSHSIIFDSNEVVLSPPISVLFAQKPRLYDACQLQLQPSVFSFPAENELVGHDIRR